MGEFKIGCVGVCVCVLGEGAWILALGLKYLFINVRTQKGHSSINNIVSQLLVNCPPTPTYNSHCYYSYMFYSRYNLRFKHEGTLSSIWLVGILLVQFSSYR